MAARRAANGDGWACRAIASGVLIGSSFVFKKRGLLRSQAGGAVAGEGVAYLKSVRPCSFPLLFHSRILIDNLSLGAAGVLQ